MMVLATSRIDAATLETVSLGAPDTPGASAAPSLSLPAAAADRAWPIGPASAAMDWTVTTPTTTHSTTLMVPAARVRLQPLDSSARVAGRKVAASVTATRTGAMMLGTSEASPIAIAARPAPTSSRQLHCAARSSQIGTSPSTVTRGAPRGRPLRTSMTVPASATATATVGTAMIIPGMPPSAAPVGSATITRAGWSRTPFGSTLRAGIRPSNSTSATIRMARTSAVPMPPEASAASSTMMLVKMEPRYGTSPPKKTTTASGPAWGTPRTIRKISIETPRSVCPERGPPQVAAGGPHRHPARVEGPIAAPGRQALRRDADGTVPIQQEVERQEAGEHQDGDDRRGGAEHAHGARRQPGVELVGEVLHGRRQVGRQAGRDHPLGDLVDPAVHEGLDVRDRGEHGQDDQHDRPHEDPDDGERDDAGRLRLRPSATPQRVGRPGRRSRRSGRRRGWTP